MTSIVWVTSLCTQQFLYLVIYSNEFECRTHLTSVWVLIVWNSIVQVLSQMKSTEWITSLCIQQFSVSTIIIYSKQFEYRPLLFISLCTELFELTSLRSGTERLSVHSWLLTKESARKERIPSQQSTIVTHWRTIPWLTLYTHVTPESIINTSLIIHCTRFQLL